MRWKIPGPPEEMRQRAGQHWSTNFIRNPLRGTFSYIHRWRYLDCVRFIRRSQSQGAGNETMSKIITSADSRQSVRQLLSDGAALEAVRRARVRVYVVHGKRVHVRHDALHDLRALRPVVLVVARQTVHEALHCRQPPCEA